jgi:hypothetical protein
LIPAQSGKAVTLGASTPVSRSAPCLVSSTPMRTTTPNVLARATIASRALLPLPSSCLYSTRPRSRSFGATSCWTRLRSQSSEEAWIVTASVFTRVGSEGIALLQITPACRGRPRADDLVLLVANRGRRWQNWTICTSAHTVRLTSGAAPSRSPNTPVY